MASRLIAYIYYIDIVYHSHHYYQNISAHHIVWIF